MSYDSYAALQGEVADWLNRGDLTAKLPGFIALFEAQFNADPRGRIQKSVVIATADVSSEYSSIPGDYAQMQNLRVPGSQAYPQGLDLLTSQQINAYRAKYSYAAEPRYYAIVGKQLRLLPTPDQSYTLEMEYFSKLPALSDAQPTNWLLEDNPHIYLYGTLLQAEPYLKNDDRIGVWRGLYDSAMEALNTTDDRALLSGATLKMRTRSFG